MKSRLVASVALALGVVVGATGCTMLTPQATTLHYDASDGVSTSVGDLAIRNVMVISGDGRTGNLVMTLVNSGDTDTEVAVRYGTDNSDATAQPIAVPAHHTVAFGATGDDSESITHNDAAPLRRLDAKPGALLPVYFVPSGGEGQTLQVPVLDGTLKEYANLVPAGVPLPTKSAAATGAPATPSSTPAP